ncbi:hypothetical protein WJX77_009379 [Trebouxia sp. C0004]
MLQMQACELAFQTGREVQHTLLDRIRQCSAAPDQAASFFLQLFHPVPHERVKAIGHAWCASTVMSMLDEMGRDAQAPAAAAEDKARLKTADSFHTAFQGVIFGESRQADQQVTEELPQAMADAVQTAAADGFDTMSVALPKQAARVRAVSVTASASSAHEPQCRACSCNMVCNVSLDDEGEVVKQQCLAGLEDVQLVGSAPLPVELQ